MMQIKLSVRFGRAHDADRNKGGKERRHSIARGAYYKALLPVGVTAVCKAELMVGERRATTT